MARMKLPRLVGKLRYMVKQFPDRRDMLTNMANRIVRDIRATNKPPEYWEYMISYKSGAALVEQMTGEKWRGERD